MLFDTMTGDIATAKCMRLESIVKVSRKEYVIPYTSIIEQNEKVFGDILGYENVLEHHCNVDYESAKEFEPM